MADLVISLRKGGIKYARVGRRVRRKFEDFEGGGSWRTVRVWAGKVASDVELRAFLFFGLMIGGKAFMDPLIMRPRAGLSATTILRQFPCSKNWKTYKIETKDIGIQAYYVVLQLP